MLRQRRRREQQSRYRDQRGQLASRTSLNDGTMRCSQNRNLAVSNTARIALTEITRPNVGEFNTVSIEE